MEQETAWGAIIFGYVLLAAVPYFSATAQMKENGDAPAYLTRFLIVWCVGLSSILLAWKAGADIAWGMGSAALATAGALFNMFRRPPPRS